MQTLHVVGFYIRTSNDPETSRPTAVNMHKSLRASDATRRGTLSMQSYRMEKSPSIHTRCPLDEMFYAKRGGRTRPKKFRQLDLRTALDLFKLHLLDRNGRRTCCAAHVCPFNKES